MKNEIAVFAGGCFWCTEAIFQRLKGVVSVESGYTGGDRENPSYTQVTTGTTGHAEAVKIIFDPEVISYETLLEVFWATHNPTTSNRQGSDTGTQYRSMILYASEDQKVTAEKSKKKLEKERIYDSPIVSEIAPLKSFYTAEEYHQNYYDKYSQESYCTYIISPKIQKILSKFSKLVKEEYKDIRS